MWCLLVGSRRCGGGGASEVFFACSFDTGDFGLAAGEGEGAERLDALMHSEEGVHEGGVV